MTLRRLAQENNAFGSPRSSKDASDCPTPSQPSTPRNRNRPSIAAAYRSPASTPSLSASVPFDWEAARSYATPPYGTPLQRKAARKSMGVGSDATPLKTPRKALVRKKNFLHRMNELPSSIAFHLSMFPQNLPLPSARTSSRLIAGTMHFTHFLLRVGQSRRASNWDDIYVEEDDTWIDWSTLLTLVLFAVSFGNAAYLFSRTRKYHFHQKEDAISSPNAKFVSKDWDQPESSRKPLWRRGLSLTWWALSISIRFLLNMSPPSNTPTNKSHSATSKVQELEVWTPGDLELQLFSLYSPVHAFLWLATQPSNWIAMLFSMGLLTITLNLLIYTYQCLVKDREYIASEVLNEYNQKFVYPRLNPIRHDVAVMTHESEIVNIW